MSGRTEQDRWGRMDSGPQAFREEEGRHAAPRSYRESHPNGNPAPPSEQAAAAEGGVANENGVAASFSTNHNSVVCLPLVSEGLKLVWTQSDQTRGLDCVPELVQAFNVFPYPSAREVASLARGCALPLDKVKVWFMVQRIKYGISWSSEEIEETRRKLAGPRGTEEEEEDEEEKERVEVREAALPVREVPLPKCPHYQPPARPHFRSSLPPPQDSYYYRPPAEPAPDPETLDSSSSPDGAPRRGGAGRYKKSKAQLAALRSSFLRENWPAEAELRRLQEETGLGRNDIRKWFSDSRYQLRMGRGSTPSLSPAFSGKKGQAPQLQPLPLVARQPQGGAKGFGGGPPRGKVACSNGAAGRDAGFFENFLSSSLEAVNQERQAVGLKAQEEEEGDEDEVLMLERTAELEMKDEEEGVRIDEEQPLQLIGNRGDPEDVRFSHKPSHAGANRSTKPAPSSAPFATTTTTMLSSSSSSTSSSSPSPVLTAAGRPRKTKEQLDMLKEHFLRCQWPKSEDYTRLVELTGLPRADVIQWFGDTRYAVKNGQLRWVRGVRDQFMAELAAQ
ncbi:hypothetical protein GJAV_G00090430, partial [Gymnothorax javanicus]